MKSRKELKQVGSCIVLISGCEKALTLTLTNENEQEIVSTRVIIDWYLNIWIFDFLQEEHPQ